MKYILSGVIRLYWLLTPGSRRRRCLFQESCSTYVYRVTIEKGGRAGLHALSERIQKCQPGYHLKKNGDTYELHLKNGTIVPEEEIAYNLFPHVQEDLILTQPRYKKRKKYIR